MQRLLVISLFMCVSLTGLSNTDSLLGVWNDKSKDDSLRMDALANYAWDEYLYTQPDSAFYYAEVLKAFAKKRNNKAFIARAIKIMAVSRQIQGNYEDAEQLYSESIVYVKEMGDDKGLANIYFNMGTMYYVRSNPDEAIKWYTKSLLLREKIKDSIGVASAMNNIGGVYNMIGEYKKSIKYFNSSLEIKVALGDKAGAARTLINVGIISYNNGDYATAIKNFTRGLKMSEEVGDKGGTATALINIGNLYNSQSNADKAIDYFKRGGQLMKESGDLKGYAAALNNIGSVYRDLDALEKALDYYNRSADINLSIEDKLQYATTLNNIGLVYMQKNVLDTAMQYFERSLTIKDSIGDLDGILTSTTNIGGIYLLQDKLDLAIQFSAKGLKLAKDMGKLAQIQESAEYLWKAYKKKKQYGKALEMYELYNDSRDSLSSEKNQKELIRQEYKYTYEKQAAADSVKAAEASKIKDAQIAKQDALAEKQEAELENKRNQQYALFGGLGLVVFFSLFIFNRFRVTKKQKGIIEVQKDEVEKQKNEAEHQKEIVEEKNKEIMDSINYAKRLQEAILPPSRLVKEWLPESFILYKPKDIVAGDFYWMESVEGWIYFAAADCTGHGVPGAMVSVVCSNALSKALIEEKKTTPAEILDRTRELVIDRFGRSEEEIKDGMDVALCALNWQTGELQYAGANNPLWIVRKGSDEVEEIKADKQPIGKYGEEKPFTNHSIKLNIGDSMYIFSDGYPDQFGGEKGKKYKSGKLKHFFVSVQDKDMLSQRLLMSEEFENWRGDIEQIDDVCVIGVRF